ncbi:PAS domain S-box protein [uncultured Draconibacterium sp.]|uniref:PAS domain-containing hybrid sensor histidine kinase/response regulator n=1 Tax=uncultured Draconibacterium sp. TaxID=1573823 RepID=UPI0029C71789|nr:PAS domain S-box protein [uncultured Draconibacterium sp.]
MTNYAHELFLLSTNLTQFKSKVLITKIFVESINSIFPGHKFRWSEEIDENAEKSLKVCTRSKTYAYISFSDQPTFTEEAFSLLQNAVQWLAILFEKLEQEILLNNQKEHLNSLVEEKTKDLAESQKQYKNLFENIIDEVHYWKVIKDKNGEIKTWELVAANPSALKAWNKTKEQVIGKTANEIFNNDAQKLFMPIVKKIFKTGKSYSWETFFPATKQYLSMDSIPLGEFFISTGRDITIKKKKEQELKEEQEKGNSRLQQIKIIQANTPNIIWKWDIDKKEKFKNSYISEVADNFLALPKGSIGNSMPKFFSYILPEYLPSVDAAIKNAIKNPNQLISIEYEIKKGDGKVAWFSSIGKAVPENNKLTIYGTTVDITEKKQIEQKLLRSDRVFNLTLDMFCIAGFDGYFKYLNPAWEKTLGWSIKELLSKPWLDFVHPDDVKKTKNVKSVIVDGKEVYQFQNRYICKDGSVKWLSWNSQPFPDENIMIGAVRDITETKRIEKELLQAKEQAEKSEKALKQSDDLMKYIIEHNRSAVAVHDKDLKYIHLSQRYLEEYNLVGLNIIGKHHYDVFPDLPQKWRDVHKKALLGIVSSAEDDPYYKDDGTVMWTRWECRPWYENDNTIGGFIIYTEEITERKKMELELLTAKEKAEESEKILKTTLKTAMDGYWVVDINGCFLNVNDTYCRMSGYNREDLLSMHISDIEAIQSHEEIIKNIQRIKQLGQMRFETKHVRKDGTIYDVEMGIQYQERNDGQFVCFIKDITEQKKHVKELIDAKERAEKSDRLKTAFLANMSHEIRTPMNGILGFTSLLQDAKLSVENQKNYIDIIEKSGDRLLNTVNDIIEISKIESGDISITKSEVDIIDHLTTHVTFFTPEAKRKNIDIIMQNNFDGNHLTITTDKNKLSSILSNLIKNAIKYTDEGTIKVGFKIENNQVFFSCQDTGIGIPKSRQEAIFNRFEQADIEDKQVHEGSGLGLAIVKSYVELLDGKIWVKSEEGKGSAFYVSLPFKQGKEEEKIIPQEVKSFDSGMKNLTVLTVEDDDISSMHLSAILNGKIKNIITAENGIEAIEIFKNDSFIDLILMDMKMPVMGGIETTKKIREFNSDVIIIAQTAYALEGDKEKALDAGCNDYITKPINAKKLLKLINKYF